MQTHPILRVDPQIARALYDTYQMLIKTYTAALNRQAAIERHADEPHPERERLLAPLIKLRESKRELERQMADILDGVAVWEEFLQHIRGVGRVLAFEIIASVHDWTRPLSAAWAYAGLTPHYWIGRCDGGHKRMYPREITHASRCLVVSKSNGGSVCGEPIVAIQFVAGAPRRQRGVLGFWSPRFRTVCWQAARSFELQSPERSFYRLWYDRFKTREARRTETPGHARNRAMRLTAKLFLAHVWEAINDLHYDRKVVPYAAQYLAVDGHDIVPWREALQYDLRARRAERPRRKRGVGGWGYDDD
jgi:hypothetical protein